MKEPERIKRRLWYKENDPMRIMFASQAMNSLLDKAKGTIDCTKLAKACYGIADEMMNNMAETYDEYRSNPVPEKIEPDGDQP